MSAEVGGIVTYTDLPYRQQILPDRRQHVIERIARRRTQTGPPHALCGDVAGFGQCVLIDLAMRRERHRRQNDDGAGYTM